MNDGTGAAGGTGAGRLGDLAHFIAHHRRLVIGTWIVLTLFGGFAAGQLSTRWYQSLAVPGKPAYEASQRTLKAVGVGDRAPSTVGDDKAAALQALCVPGVGLEPPTRGL